MAKTAMVYGFLLYKVMGELWLLYRVLPAMV